jgi:iron complex transport system permease protein
VVGLLVGAAFGMSGALIQTVATNALANPDVIGVSHGAGAATVAAMTYGVTSYTMPPYVSIGGGLAAAALVYVFAWRKGLHASRFVLIGIGFSVALGSLTQLILTRATTRSPSRRRSGSPIRSRAAGTTRPDRWRWCC